MERGVGWRARPPVGELLLRKALACRNRIERIRAALPADPNQILSDERLEAFIAFNIFLLVQDSIDLAAHLAAARGLDVPGSHRETFEALARANLISRETSAAMGQMAALRNRVAHSYGDLDPVRMVREAPTGLVLVGTFLDELAGVLSQSSG
jgi:uncharacterized protein YutE (UPF0331/DUF86 family)